MDDYISRQAAIDAMKEKVFHNLSDEFYGVMQVLDELPSADVIVTEDLLGWLLAYHTKSFGLKGRYMPHEVISWLINDLAKNFIGERGEQNES